MSDKNTFSTLLDFLQKLTEVSIYYELSAPLPRSVLVTVIVPGERWEVEFMESGEIGVEVFRSRAGVESDDKLTELFERFSD